MRNKNRVRQAAQLIQRAVADGWKRTVARNSNLVAVTLESRKIRGFNGRILFFFWRSPATGNVTVELTSRFLDPRGSKRVGFPKAWAVFFSLKEVAS